MVWKEITPGTWKPENEGDSVEGILISKETGKGTHGSNAYNLEHKDKEGELKQILVWGSTVLDERMKFTNAGDKVKIEYKGTETNKKGQPVKIFKIYREEINS